MAKRSKGSVTVFTALILAPFVLAASVFIAVGYNKLSERREKNILYKALMSAAASYDIDIRQNYGLYAIKKGADTSTIFLRFLERHRGSINYNGCIMNDEILLKQIRAEMEYKTLLIMSESIMKSLKREDTKNKNDKAMVRSTGELTIKVTDEIIKTVISELTRLTDIPKLDIDVGDMVKGFKQYFKTMYLDSNQVSRSWLWSDDNLDLNSDIDSEEGEISIYIDAQKGAAEYSGLIDKILKAVNELYDETAERADICAYIIDRFTYCGSEIERTAFFKDTEIEYIIWGKTDAVLNMEKMTDFLLILRTALDFIDFYSRLELADPSVRMITALILAEIQGMTDTLTLIGGGTVNLFPESVNIKTEYADYLLLGILMRDNQTLLKRIKDVININIKYKDREASAETLYTEIEGVMYGKKGSVSKHSVYRYTYSYWD